MTERKLERKRARGKKIKKIKRNWIVNEEI